LFRPVGYNIALLLSRKGEPYRDNALPILHYWIGGKRNPNEQRPSVASLDL